MYGEVIVTGDEILNGEILDTNSQWLSLRLESLGVRMLYHAAVCDELDAISGVFRIALERARCDCLYRWSWADRGRSDARRPSSGHGEALLAKARRFLSQLQALCCQRRNRPFTGAHRKQALFPEGSQPDPQPRGTAPGIALEVAPAWPRARTRFLPAGRAPAQNARCALAERKSELWSWRWFLQ